MKRFEGRKSNWKSNFVWTQSLLSAKAHVLQRNNAETRFKKLPPNKGGLSRGAPTAGAQGRIAIYICISAIGNRFAGWQLVLYSCYWDLLEYAFGNLYKVVQ